MSASRSSASPPRARLEAAIAAAAEARSRAYAPYSGFRVGAAVLTRSGGLHVGCNIENASYGATLCAERAAIAVMIAAGDRDPIGCAVVTEGTTAASPCGICRQVLSEFGHEMKIVLIAHDRSGRVTARHTTRLSRLLPRAFRLRARPMKANVRESA